jgi:hypothetical protein
MLEIAIVLATLALLGAGSFSVPALSPELLLQLGFWTTALGLALGLPTGALYHVGLHRSLARVGRLPRRWWLHPTAHHRLLPPEDAPGVLAWCRAGALGCAVAFLGCAVAALGVWKALA